MSFSSLSFLLLVLIAVVVNYLVSQRYRWIWLLAVSIYFYLNWQPLFAVLLLITTIITYLSAVLMDKPHNSETCRKIICIVGCILPLTSLGLFKYYTFLTTNISALLSVCHIHIDFPQMKLLLPIGISFYTFTAVGYLIDIYRRKYTPERNFGILALFISFFAQILSGPIPRGDGLIPQLRHPEALSYQNISTGISKVGWGFFMKLCVADRLSIYVNTIFGNIDNHNGGSMLLASLLYTIQIYADFAGYSLVALGIGRMLGLHLIENFRRPYFASSVKDFWSRWHISLSTWFRDYVYITLGGNRRTPMRTRLNLFLTFLVSGLWHGAAWNFILWGGVHGSAQIVEKALPKLRFTNDKINIIIVFFIVSFCWVFFRLESVADIRCFFVKIFTDFGIPFIEETLVYGAVAIALLFIKDYVDEFHPHLKMLNSENYVVRSITIGFVISATILLGVFGSNSFIYFQF